MFSLKKIACLLLLVIFCMNIAEAKRQKKKSTATQVQGKKKSKKSKESSSKKSTVVNKNSFNTVLPKQYGSVEINDYSARIDREGLGDTSNPREVLITSTFKPVLKNAAKINFTAASTLADSSKLAVTYKIPSQTLFFSYQPVSIKPVALNQDSLEKWQNDHFIKLGFGNFSTPFAEAGFTFGDGKQSSIAIHGNHISSKGNLPFQQFGKTGVDLLSIFNTVSQHEWTSKAFYQSSTQYFYGFQPSLQNFTKDSLLQRFNTVGLEVGVQNKQIGNYGLSYHPQIFLTYFTDNNKGNEFNFIGKLPFTKSFGRVYSFGMGITADIVGYNSPMLQTTLQIKNNLFYIDPALQFKTPNFKLNFGIKPSWDNQKFSLLPNITAEARIKETGINIELGWIGYFQKNGYRTLASFNPWILRPTSILNTKIKEQYIGLKGNAGNHLTYQVRVSFMQLYDQPLFVNNYTDGKSFNVLVDPKIQLLRLHGELGYHIQEKFSFIGSINLNEYTNLASYDKAYGLVPLEIIGSLKWKILKDLQLKSDLFVMDGAPYQNKLNQSAKLDPALDMNLGLEFAVTHQLNIWLQMNNLFNNKYQRWNQYEVLGFNVLGGVVYSFK